MQLKPTLEPRERILLYGGAGSGKSDAILRIARKIPGHMYIVDNDNSYPRLLATDFSDLTNVTVYDVDNEDWIEQLTAAQDAHKLGSADPNNWWAFDMVTETWQAVQSWFTEKVYGVDHADFFMEQRIRLEANKSKQTVETVNDDRWTVINNQYKKLQNLILKTQCHVICAAEASAFSQYDGKNVKAEYGDYMFKPKGQKRMPYVFSTVIFMDKTRAGDWKMSTVKDRGRVEMIDVEVKDFAVDYLMKVAKWRPTKG